MYFILCVSLIIIQSCKEEGCTDPSASNYNPNASKEDNSCRFLPPNITNIEYAIVDQCETPLRLLLNPVGTQFSDNFSCNWVFSDGSSIIGNCNPVFLLDDFGNYSVTLTLASQNGEDVFEKNIFLEYQDVLIGGNGEFTNNNDYAPAQLKFQEECSNHEETLYAIFTESLFGGGSWSEPVAFTDSVLVNLTQDDTKFRLFATCGSDQKMKDYTLDIQPPAQEIELEELEITFDNSFNFSDFDLDDTLEIFVKIFRNDVVIGTTEVYEMSPSQRTRIISFPSGLETGEDELSLNNLDRVRIEILDKDQGDPDLINSYFITKSSILERYYPENLFWNQESQPSLRLNLKYQ